MQAGDSPRRVLIILLSVQALICCGRTQERALRCCVAGLIEPEKLLRANRPGVPGDAMTFALDYAAGQRFDLAQLLRQPAAEALLWSVNGSEIKGSIFQPHSGPKDDAVLIYAIGVRRKSDRSLDEFRLLSLAAGTRARFTAWLAHEREDTSWISQLPPVYASLGPNLSNPEPKNCPQTYWEGVHKLNTNFHPGGAYEMRSRPFGDGSGHQAVYDSAGMLIQEGLGAGSADRGAPRFWAFGYLKHRDRDVRTFVWAAQLDGNPVNPTWLFLNLSQPLIRQGDHIRGYQSVRPALANQPATVPAGTCIGPVPRPK